MLKTTPFWIDTVTSTCPISPLPAQADIAIVGGGYTGLSAARTLAKAGLKVVVLEQGRLGQGASSMNGGQVSTGLKEGAPSLIKQYGPIMGRELWEASVRAVHLVKDMIAEEQIACDFKLSGSLHLAYRPRHYDHLARKADWIVKHLNYHEQTLIPKEKLSEHIGSEAFYGGLLDHLGGSLDPAKYLQGMAQAAVTAGAMLCEQAQVLTVERPISQGDYQLETTQGLIRAHQVLVATNGYTGSLVPQIQRRVFPVGSYMITTAPISPRLQRELSPRDHVFYDSNRFLNYFRLTPDGRVTVGGRNSLDPHLDLHESATYLREAMLRIYPQTRELPITHSWGGRLGVTFDVMPHIGRVQGIYYALGYCGHGVTMATYLGQEVARLMSGQIRRSPFMEIAHQTYFFYRQKPWFLPFAAAFYRVLDQMS